MKNDIGNVYKVSLIKILLFKFPFKILYDLVFNILFAIYPEIFKHKAGIIWKIEGTDQKWTVKGEY